MLTSEFARSILRKEHNMERCTSPRLNALRRGDLVDLTHILLGPHKAKTGLVSVACSLTFFQKALGNTTSERNIHLLTQYVQKGDFTWTRNRVNYPSRCVHRQEVIEGKQVSCFTFFIKWEQERY